MHRYLCAALVAVGVPHAAYATALISDVVLPRLWRGKIGFLLFAFLCAVPGSTHAAVVISEVAWMGSPDNANAEWIELYNDGPAENLTGWSLTTVDGAVTIVLSGTMPKNSYAVLERTNDAAVPSVPAFTIYTGSMSNTGELLILRDDHGSLVQHIDGRSAWSIGGNNDTKETLQRSGTPSTGLFVTAPPTPGTGGARPIQAVTHEDKAPVPKPETPPTQRAVPAPEPRPVPEADTYSTVASDTPATVAATQAFREPQHDRGQDSLWWYMLGLGAAILVTVTTVMMLRREHTETIAGFEIEADDIPYG